MCDFIFLPIFCGTWDQVRSLGPELIPCPRCHNAAIRTIRRRTWMTLYCVPVFPISRKRQLYHCDICRWEGVPIQPIQETQHNHHRRRRNHQGTRSSTPPGARSNTQNRSLYIPPSSTSGSEQALASSPHFQPVQYSINEYQAPPPPYTKAA
ncbi:hypothetical protein IWW35_002502 [Coemansia sp. RSA 1878]|nr:hypothetical protein IWW35_002502 [Coemansia sp. RSA 1878]